MEKEKRFLTILLFVVLLSACVRPVTGPTSSPTTKEPFAGLPEVPTSTDIQPSNTPTMTATAGEEEPSVEPTQEPEDIPPTPFTISTDIPTASPLPVEAPGVSPTPEPTNTPRPPKTPSAPPKNPEDDYGNPNFIENFEDSTAWQDYYGSMENDNIALAIEDGQMQVTGKKNEGFKTWWFGGFELTNFYIEMTVNSGECSGKDAYGLILRGEPSSHGYIIAFTCEGQVVSWRLDSVNPYIDLEILGYTDPKLIHKGSDQSNVMSVLMEDDKISIFVNGYYFTILSDSTYEYGQWGIFVMAWPTENYTFTVSQIRVWYLNH